MQISQHSQKRMKERIGVPKKSHQRQLELAIGRGLRHNECKGNLFKWVNQHVPKSPEGSQFIIYNNNLFVIAKDGVLVTVLPLPASLQKLASKLQKKKKEKNK